MVAIQGKPEASPPTFSLRRCLQQCYTTAMSYQKDYAKAALEMKAALEDLRIAKIRAAEIIQKAESRAVALQRKMAALHVLIVADNPEWEHSEDAELSLKVLHATSRPSEQLRRVFALSKGPLTVKQLRDELGKVGCDLSEQANPSGTIGALCARLVEQGVIQLTKKAGRNAWTKI
jgi:hypothetical protein